MFNLASFTRPYFGAVLLSAVLLTAGGEVVDLVAVYEQGGFWIAGYIRLDDGIDPARGSEDGMNRLSVL